ncbi:GIY-YIG nuclease family protein [Methylophilaceae bacterium]|jgi:putative endonuclease|nr:GIY-YIG nuclease family protein [Methylophilaceae bacterium]
MANYNVSGLQTLSELAALNKKSWFVYIILCKDETLYTGITNNIEKRLSDHTKGNGAKYTKSRGPFTLMYTEKCSDRVIASQREFQIKKMTRAKKLALSNQQ